MRRENWIYLFSFIGGVVIVSLLGNETWANNSVLNRYSLATLSFREIVYEQYLLKIFLLRFRTVAGLWMLSKLIPKKIVEIGFAFVVCGMLGGIIAMAIMANGIWGVCFFLCALLPQSFFYGVAFVLWCNMRTEYRQSGGRKRDYWGIALLCFLIGAGCISETFISPVLIENVIKL